ncbi:2-oxoglutarate dehydrogenase complex E2 component [Kappamyces sp. JEL0680]|nr:2-oxoglutarate dehydrogenase complex E2 component [Kappamyces sp. JEL0680]
MSQLLRVPDVHSFPVTALDFNSDATVVLSGSADGSICAISIPEPTELSYSWIVYLLFGTLFLAFFVLSLPKTFDQSNKPMLTQLLFRPKRFSTSTRAQFRFSKFILAAPSGDAVKEFVVKTPSMGESITEGTLTSWLKSKLLRVLSLHAEVGDSVSRDEQVASIETDKIDVAVNSPESGSILELFHKDGDTVAVGQNLFKIALGADGGQPAKAPAKEPVDSAPKESSQPAVAPSRSPTPETPAEPHHRIPLIKFLGPRKYGQAHSAKAADPSPTDTPKPASAPKVDGNRIFYDDIEAMPKRYRPPSFSPLEMQLIDISASSGVFELLPLDFGLAVIHAGAQIDLVSYTDHSLLKSWSSKVNSKTVFCSVLDSTATGPVRLVKVSQMGQQYFYEEVVLSPDGIKLAEHHALAFSDVPVALSLGPRGRLHSIYQNGTLEIFAASRDGAKSTQVISLQKYLDAPGKKGKAGLAMCSLSSGCVAVVSQKGPKSFLTLWDSSYGTLQLEKQVYDGTTLDVPDKNSIRAFSLVTCHSPMYGNVLALSTVSKTPKSSKYSCQFDMIPYYSPPVSLLSALGKRSSTEPAFDLSSFTGQLVSIIPVAPPPAAKQADPVQTWKAKVAEWNRLDADSLDRLLDTTATPSVPVFQEKFVEWITAKHTSLQGWQSENASKSKAAKPDGSSGSLIHMPKTELSQKAISLLMQRCFAGPATFWPRAVVEYLICGGSVSASNTGPNGESLVQSIILRGDIDLLEKCFLHVVDMNEKDYVDILQYVAATDESSPVPQLCQAWWEDKQKRRARKESKETPHGTAKKSTNSVKNGEIDVQSEPLGVSLNDGQKELLHLCFSSPRIDAVFSKQLGSLLPAQLHFIFEWLRGILAPQYDTTLSNQHPDQKFPLWWLWYDQPLKTGHKTVLDREYEKWITARLRGPLMGTVDATIIAKHTETKKNAKGGSGYGRNWNNLVEQMEIGVGEYAIEVLQL